LLIALYLFDEHTFDRFHKHAPDIYRVVQERTAATGRESKVAAVAYNIGAHAKTDFPEVDDVATLNMLGRVNIANNENTNTFYESYWIANDAFLQVFDFKLLAGDRSTALHAPNSVMLTAETAVKIFGNTNVVGKTIRADKDSLPYKVTAVLENIPANSHLKFNLVFSEATLKANKGFNDFIMNDWTSNSFTTYLLLKENNPPQRTAEKIRQLVETNAKQSGIQTGNFILQPLTDIHFYSKGIEGDSGSGDIFYSYVFALVALFVLLIACINYINLTTARFASRAKEIAVRKVAGAARKNLIGQFFSEALLMTFLALVLATGAVQLLLPAFNRFTEKALTLGFHTDQRLWLGILATVLLAGLLAGAYPAFFQSRLKPLQLLKNKVEENKLTFSIRRSLVVFQFALSIIMIVATLVVYMQLKYVNTKNIGFNKEQLLVIDINSGAVRRSAETIKAEYAKLPSVKSVSVSSRVPGEWKVLPKVKVKNTAQAPGGGDDMYFIGADDQFFKTFEIAILKGRNFSAANIGDSSAIVVNETAAKLLGISGPSEQLVQIPSIDFDGNIETLDHPFQARVIGIARDFNFRSLREKVAPMVIGYQNNPLHKIDYFTAKIAAGNIPQTLAGMESILHKIDPGHLFEYNFLDKQWDLFYREDQKRQTIFLAIAVLTILIASLGLFGLATYASQQRIKEIGIRKVLGASVSSIVSLLSKDFLKLVLLSALIAFPAGWWAMNMWLKDFAYRVDIKWWVFALAGMIAILIALLTISFQTIKTALSNPIKNLRTE
jgi:putative ABC transport system permease protein